MWIFGEINEWAIGLFTKHIQRPSDERRPRSDQRRITAAYADAWTLRDSPNALDETLRAQLSAYEKGAP